MTDYHDHNPPFHKTPDVEKVEAVRVTFLRGIGCCNRHPLRQVTAYYVDGELIAELDPWAGPDDSRPDLAADVRHRVSA